MAFQSQVIQLTEVPYLSNELSFEMRLFLLDNAFTDAMICVDPYVDWKIHRAIQLFRQEAYDATIIFLGAAIEEELARVYEMKNDNPDMKNEKRGSVKKEIVGQGKLIYDDDDMKLIDSIFNARDYFAHSHRMLKGNTRDRLKKKNISLILPDYYNNPRIGDLSQQEPALLALEKTIKFIINTTNQYPVEKVDGEDIKNRGKVIVEECE